MTPGVTHLADKTLDALARLVEVGVAVDWELALLVVGKARQMTDAGVPPAADDTGPAAE